MNDLETPIEAVRNAEGRWRTLRALGLAAGSSALGWHLDFAALGLAAGVALLLAAWWTRPSASAAARRLDRAAALDGALECAWDHRKGDDPILAAQRARALRALPADAAARATTRPSLLWALPAALWLLPAQEVRVAPEGSGGPPSPGAPAPAAVDGAEGARRGEAAKAARAAAKAARSEPDAGGSAGDAGPGGAGDPSATGVAGGVGARAGDRAGGHAGGAAIAPSPGEGPALVLPRAAGVGEGAGAGAAASPAGRPPVDDVADPARPYPRRYREVVTAWFSLSER